MYVGSLTLLQSKVVKMVQKQSLSRMNLSGYAGHETTFRWMFTIACRAVRRRRRAAAADHNWSARRRHRRRPNVGVAPAPFSWTVHVTLCNSYMLLDFC